MSITPNTPAVFYGFNDQLISIPLITLNIWQKGLHTVQKTGEDFRGIESVVRAKLETPLDYELGHIIDHIDTVLRQTHEHYGIKYKGKEL